MTELTELGAQPPEITRLALALEETLEEAQAMAQRLGAAYPQALEGAWQGEAHDRFSAGLGGAAQSMQELCGAYRRLTGLLREACQEYGRAEEEALRRAGGG